MHMTLHSSRGGVIHIKNMVWWAMVPVADNGRRNEQAHFQGREHIWRGDGMAEEGGGSNFPDGRADRQLLRMNLSDRHFFRGESFRTLKKGWEERKQESLTFLDFSSLLHILMKLKLKLKER